ncbi:MAG: hypothetical protein JSV49_07930 [Thermoplasmata archaeon]|nr:MAG: hypothetical protein JSV49_07930 [Thermoplasmata archaeon]
MIEIPRCLDCNSVMFHIVDRDQWYCQKCGEYDTHKPHAAPPPPPPSPPSYYDEPAPPPQRAPPPSYYDEPARAPPPPPRYDQPSKPRAPKKKDEHNATVIVIISVVIVIIIIGVAMFFLLNKWAEDLGESGEDDEEFVPGFPVIEVNIYDFGGTSQDEIKIRHISGDPLDWSDWKLVITNNSDDSSITLADLSSKGEIQTGESTTIDDSINGFSMNFKKGSTYTIDIFNIEYQKKAYGNKGIVCK